MAYPTAVNSQITDSVTQNNVKVVGEAPAMALGSLYQAAASAAGHSIQNAVTAQQQAQVLAQSVTANCVRAVLGTPLPSAAAP